MASDSPGQVDFATGQVNSVLSLPDRHLKFFGEFTVINPLNKKNFSGLYKVTLGMEHSNYSFPEW